MAKKSNLNNQKESKGKQEKNNAKSIQSKNPIFAQPQETKQDKTVIPASSSNGQREEADKFIIKATPELIAEWAKSKAEFGNPDSVNKATEATVNSQGANAKEESKASANSHTANLLISNKKNKLQALPLEVQATVKEFSALGFEPQENKDKDKFKQTPDITPAFANKAKNDVRTRL